MTATLMRRVPSLVAGLTAGAQSEAMITGALPAVVARRIGGSMSRLPKSMLLFLIKLHAAVKRSESVDENSPRCLQRGDNDRPVDRQKSISNYSALGVWLIR